MMIAMTNNMTAYLWYVISPLLYDGMEPGEHKQRLRPIDEAVARNKIGRPVLVGAQQILFYARRRLFCTNTHKIKLQ